MKVLSRAVDNRINSTNLYVEISFGEYLSFARDIISNNDLQRNALRRLKLYILCSRMILSKDVLCHR